MQIMVLADEAIEQEFENKKLNDSIKVIFIKSSSEIINDDNTAALFILKEEINKEEIKDFGSKPVFINSTIHTLKELGVPENFSRINGWPTFVNREILEIATCREDDVKYIFGELGWKFIKVADQPGFVSARIISMIINEAYFALGENVSSKDEIDVAMKLGTNYPYGPFEWSKKIGLNRVYSLLEKLSETDRCYSTAPAMKNELLNH
jgi:3-hydroxybutyryl-CoA dehydrogenase